MLDGLQNPFVQFFKILSFDCEFVLSLPPLKFLVNSCPHLTSQNNVSSSFHFLPDILAYVLGSATTCAIAVNLVP